MALIVQGDGIHVIFFQKKYFCMTRGKDLALIVQGDGIHYILSKKMVGHETGQRFGPHFVQGWLNTCHFFQKKCLGMRRGKDFSPTLCKGNGIFFYMGARRGKDLTPMCAGRWNTCH